MNEKNRRNREQVSDEFYATLPLKGMDSAKVNRNSNYLFFNSSSKLENKEI